MKNRELFGWLALAAVAVVAVAMLLPRALPFYLLPWSYSAQEARALALSRVTELGELPTDPYVVVRPRTDPLLETALLRSGVRDWPRVADELPDAVAGWEVLVYAADAAPQEWSFRTEISASGKLLALRKSLPPETERGELSPEEARDRAREYLREQGFRMDRFAEPELRSKRLAGRSDLELRYPLLDGPLSEGEADGDGVPHGIQVHFLGDELAGYSPWLDLGDERAQKQLFQQYSFVEFGLQMGVVVLLLLAMVPFVRKYHEGEIGIRRSVHLFLAFLTAGILALLLSGGSISQGTSIGAISRRMVTFVVVLYFMVFVAVPGALLGAVSWAVGEVGIRERAGRKLASFDGLLRGRWQNATVARASFRGTVLGLALLAVAVGVTELLSGAGYRALGSFQLQEAMQPTWPGLALLLWDLSRVVPLLLAATLLFGPLFRRRLGLRRSILVAGSFAWLVVAPWLLPLPLTVGALVWAVGGIGVMVVFAFTDLLTALLCGLVAQGVFQALPLVVAGDPWLQTQGCLALLVLVLPMLVSFRSLQTDRELAYSYEDIPPHVRRIAQRERQRVELETAREIQSSILPELPPQLAGVELAHAYQPAKEVGGDFYEVLVLEDGRLAVAVGDVAGHGVSSGLVMSMVKSALAVQVTFDPGVDSVLRTLNRMVYQSARRRLLTTLSYALVDPGRRELVYASAGHIFPYRVRPQGIVHELEAGEYPLGVRSEIVPRVRTERLEPGDSVVLLSDGVVERTPEGSDEPFGFERLRESLARRAGASPRQMVDGLLRDLEETTGEHPREDDLTVLVLRLPAA